MGGPLLKTIDGVGHAGRVLGQALRIPQADGTGEELEGVHETPAGLEAALEFEGDHAARLAHLAAGEVTLGKGGQAGVMDDRHRRMALQEFRHLDGIEGMAVHAQGQGLEAAQDEEGILGGEHGPGHVLDADETHLVQDRLRPDDGPRQQVPVATQILGGGMDDQVGPQFQGALQVRRAIGVVHHRQGPVATGDIRDGGDIHQTHVGIGRRLEKDHAGAGRDGGGQVGRVGQIQVPDLDPELLQPMVEKGEGATVEGLVRDQFVPRLQQGPEQGGGSPLTRGGHQGRLSYLEIGQPFLQQPGSRIADPGVNISRPLAGEAGHALGDRGESVGGTEVDGRTQGAGPLVGIVSVVDGAGGKSKRLGRLIWRHVLGLPESIYSTGSSA